MGWLETGIGWLKTAETFVEPISQFLKKEGDYKGLRMGEKDPETGKYPDTGFMTAQARDKFVLPKGFSAAGFTLLTQGIGKSTKGLTNVERILSPIHKLQANGYDALANVLIQKAIKDSNLVSERDLLSGTVSATESQNIKLGKVDI